jgi:hypothetical protein
VAAVELASFSSENKSNDVADESTESADSSDVLALPVWVKLFSVDASGENDRAVASLFITLPLRFRQSPDAPPNASPIALACPEASAPYFRLSPPVQ